jgi:hypothetical protein
MQVQAVTADVHEPAGRRVVPGKFRAGAVTGVSEESGQQQAEQQCAEQ